MFDMAGWLTVNDALAMYIYPSVNPADHGLCYIPLPINYVYPLWPHHNILTGYVVMYAPTLLA